MTAEPGTGTVEAMRVNAPEITDTANSIARSAAERSGVAVRDLHEISDLRSVIELFHDVWQPDESSPLVTMEQLRALTHSGNYLAGAFEGDRLVGACVGFFAAPAGTSLHSHIAGVAGRMRGRNVGFALKLHQRAWALSRGLAEITWTFDPLVRRNAHFNLIKLGARPREYLVDFYGEVNDGINSGQGSDRLLAAWPLTAPAVIDACAGRRAEVDDDAGWRTAGAVTVLGASDTSAPVRAAGAADNMSRFMLVHLPPDIEAMRRLAPDQAREWRLAVRATLGELMGAGAVVIGLTGSGSYLLEGTGS